jgi:hypothetical protein
MRIARTPQEIAEVLSRPMQVYRLKVAFVSGGPVGSATELSRTIDIRGDYTLFDVHLMIQRGFGWDNDHLFAFFLSGKLWDRETEYSANPLGEPLAARPFSPPPKSAAGAELRDLGLTKGKRFAYLFDFGDELLHEVEVVDVRAIGEDDKDLPKIVARVGEKIE